MHVHARLLGLLIAGATTAACAADEPAPTAPATPAALVLPAVRFYSSVAADDIYAQLHADPLLSHLGRESPGCPIVLRVTHSVEPTSGGRAAGTATGLLAATTLGIIPVVTNEDFVVNYELFVNNSLVSTHAYRRNFTRSRNLWTMDKKNPLGTEGLAWVKSTVAQFLGEARGDPAFADLVAEYTYYFGALPPVPAADAGTGMPLGTTEP